jgi:hypothetical protein
MSSIMHVIVLWVISIAVLFGLVWVLYHKLSKTLESIRHAGVANANNVVTQIESLMGVYAEVKPIRALPRSRRWAASPDLLALLISHAQRECPENALECGSGISTLALAACARNADRGHVWSLEHSREHAERTRNLLALQDLTPWATVLDAPLRAYEINGWGGQWYDLSALPDEIEFSLLVVDGPPDELGPCARYPALPLLMARLSTHATIVLDDADRSSERVVLARWMGEIAGLRAIPHDSCEKGSVILVRTPV